MKTPDTKWFVSKMAANNISQRKLADLIELDSSAVSLMFRGKRLMQLHEAEKIAFYLNVSVEQVLAHAGLDIHPEGKRRVAVAGWIDGAGLVHEIAEGEEITAPVGFPEHTVALQMRTSMTPLGHMDGWTMFISSWYEPDSRDLLDRWCCIEMITGEKIVAYVKPGYKRNRFNLLATCDRTDVEIVKAAPVMWISTDRL